MLSLSIFPDAKTSISCELLHLKFIMLRVLMCLSILNRRLM